MDKTKIYFKLECKRIMKLLPGILAITLFVLTITGFLLANKYFDKQSSIEDTHNVSDLKNMKIGIVANEGEMDFLDIALYLIEQTDDFGDICSFIFVSENEGQKMLEQKELDILTIFPDNYVKSVYRGTEEPIVVRFGTAQSGVSSLMFRQLADSLTNYMMECKAAVYTLQDKYDEWDISVKKDDEQITAELIKEILNRTSLLKQETVSATEGLHSILYYVCVAIVLMTLLWALSCGSVLGKNSKTMPMLLERQGVSPLTQYLVKFASLFLFFLTNYLVIAVIAMIVTHVLGITFIPISAYFMIIPILLPACAITLCVYELSKDGIGGMLFLFFGTVIFSFLSGFFYPLSYFPVWMQKIAAFLPTKVMFHYVSCNVVKANAGYSFVGLLIYTMIFALITLIPSFTESRPHILNSAKRRK